jgi:hypothetical protein
VREFKINGFKLISRLDRDVGILIDNCLGFLYSIDLRHDMRREIGRIEAALYDMVYLGRTPAGCSSRRTFFVHAILPLMKRLAPGGYYFGIDPDHAGCSDTGSRRMARPTANPMIRWLPPMKGNGTDRFNRCRLTCFSFPANSLTRRFPPL